MSSDAPARTRGLVHRVGGTMVPVLSTLPAPDAGNAGAAPSTPTPDAAAGTTKPSVRLVYRHHARHKRANGLHDGEDVESIGSIDTDEHDEESDSSSGGDLVLGRSALDGNNHASMPMSAWTHTKRPLGKTLDKMYRRARGHRRSREAMDWYEESLFTGGNDAVSVQDVLALPGEQRGWLMRTHAAVRVQTPPPPDKDTSPFRIADVFSQYTSDAEFMASRDMGDFSAFMKAAMRYARDKHPDYIDMDGHLCVQPAGSIGNQYAARLRRSKALSDRVYKETHPDAPQ